MLVTLLPLSLPFSSGKETEEATRFPALVPAPTFLRGLVLAGVEGVAGSGARRSIAVD